MNSQFRNRLCAGLLGITATAILLMTIAAGQGANHRPVEELISAHTVVLFAQDGSANHQAAWEQTAAYESLYESGLAELLEKVFAFVAQQTGQHNSAELRTAIKQIEQQGLTLAIALPDQGPPLPQLTLVLHNSASLQRSLERIAATQLRELGLNFEPHELQGRTIHSAIVPRTPGVEISFWSEGGHLILAAGIRAASSVLAVVDGEAPHLGSNRVWQKYHPQSASFAANRVAWLDFAALRKHFGGLPIPQPGHGTVNDALRALGLQNLDTLAWQFGYKGRSLWSQGHMEIDGPRTGLLSLLDQQPFSLQELPPLPQNVSGFSATRLDLAQLWQTLISVARSTAALGPPDAEQHIKRTLNELHQTLGFDIQQELLEPLGDVFCVFTDPDQGFMGAGTGAALSVDDAATLRNSIDRLLAMATAASRGQFSVRKTEKNGREILLFQFAQQAQLGALTIDDQWMMIGLMPQTIAAYALRSAGKLPVWEPTSSQAEALAELPSQFNSISLGDPRATWQSLMKLAPPAMIAAEIALKENGVISRDTELPITTADIPPAELVVQPLFPNVSVTVMDASGLHITTRRSMPGIPLLGGVGEGDSALTIAVATALVLPAIQAAREAARRTQSANNLKQLALALHNYHDTHQSFPPGSHPNEKLKPERRLSWLASILPYVEQGPLYENLDFEEAWDDEVNRKATAVLIPVYRNPGQPADPGRQTHYVGIAGLGQDAADLPVTHRRAGIFGHNRRTSIRHILDGTSNTVMISEANGKLGPWAQAGHTSYRPFTRKPYVNGPDGIGGPVRRGCYMSFADGSVRFISENVDPSVIEALSTMAGREVVPNF